MAQLVEIERLIQAASPKEGITLYTSVRSSY
jgi:hypothetical protein